jgi:uncharacterized protein with HEPN domain
LSTHSKKSLPVTLSSLQQFTVDNMSYGDLESDKKTLYAVIRCLEIIGEAVKKIPTNIKEKYSEIPWKEIGGMRDKLIHEYFGVDIETIWDTIHEDLSPLKSLISRMINDLYSKQ